MASNDSSPPMHGSSHPADKAGRVMSAFGTTPRPFPTQYGDYRSMKYSTRGDDESRFYTFNYNTSTVHTNCGSHRHWLPPNPQQSRPMHMHPGWRPYAPTPSQITSCPPGPSFSTEKPSSREDFIPPRHQFVGHLPSPAQVTPSRPTKSGGIAANNDDSSNYISELQGNDIVCGRGAPTSFHHGNHTYRELVADYQTVYLCSKRSDKPKIAMELLELVRSRGGRFVRRVKRLYKGRFGWEENGEKQAHEKVCQALREGAPELRRKMLASSYKLREINREKDNHVPSLQCFQA
jgi:hypothetical protein